MSVLGAWRNAQGQQELDELFGALEESVSDCTSYAFELQAYDVVGDMAYTAGLAQVCSMSSSSHVRTLLTSGGPLDTCEAPRPGRSGAMTRWVVTSAGITRIHTAAKSPCSKTIGGPSPPSRMAVDTPANCNVAR